MQVAEKIKSDLHEIGITIHVKPLPFDKIVNLIYKKEFDLALVSLDMKGEISMVEAMAGGSDKNYSGLHSNALKNSIEKLTINEENYQNHIEDFISIYHSELPYIGLYYKTSTLLTNKSVKGNFNPSWSNYYRNIVTFCK
jgi:ABC-type transport system substrate-binding protein